MVPDEPKSRVSRPVRGAYAMRALGRDELPQSIQVGDQVFRREIIVKHDFWAATGFYRHDRSGRRVVLKVARTADYAGIPLEWAGRWLCRRESRIYQRLSDLPNVPAFLGRYGRTGFVHDYAEGRPLSRRHPVPDGFFEQLAAVFQAMHDRGMAYVDANKPENILQGDDGRPHLIDFQISWDSGGGQAGWVWRWWTYRFQQADWYHLLKHKRRLRPDEMTADEMARSHRRGALIEFHRWATRPYQRFRKRIFARLEKSGRLLPSGSE